MKRQGMTIARRNTVIIDPKGTIRKLFPAVEPTDHARKIHQTSKRCKPNDLVPSKEMNLFVLGRQTGGASALFPPNPDKLELVGIEYTSECPLK